MLVFENQSLHLLTPERYYEEWYEYVAGIIVDNIGKYGVKVAKVGGKWIAEKVAKGSLIVHVNCGRLLNGIDWATVV